ncbi:Immunoglobulin V-set domain [Nesidiocoris tenuis]|uniref:Immunoglobulin V-set domain n=1 Tax=Nesidiocoris tenuis TaxID=355587 RepID=A0ABN7AAA6_9HEMI|nr:Immunoglobulin V-set domain [Nesidiocoris tenuis]
MEVRLDKFAMALWRYSAFFFLLTTCSYSQDVLEDEWTPKFAMPIANVTVALGREAVLSCTVNNLGHLKVGWLRAEDQTVLSLDSKVVTHNVRVSVSHEPESDTWRLHIRQVKPSDKGCYMCQINTINMKKQVGCLDVHVPPDILDAGTSSDTEVQEGDNVTLVCAASGQPPPRIQWRREDARLLQIYNGSVGFVTVDSYSGERLDLVKVDYTQMGAYLCIASNDIPPAVSKRIVLKVNFAPVARQSNQVVGAVLGSSVNLVCNFHAYPSDNTSWYREVSEIHEYGGDYKIGVTRMSYEVTLHLTVRNIRPIDFGKYFCGITNNIGQARSTITLYEIKVETTTVPSSPPTTTTTEPTTTPTSETTTVATVPELSTSTEATNSNEIEELASLFNDNTKRGAEASSRRRSYAVSSSSSVSIGISLFLASISYQLSSIAASVR